MVRSDRTPAVVVITRDRRERVLTTVERMANLPEGPEVIVVDNGSTDGTADAMGARHPRARVIRLPVNAGAAARNCGVAVADASYVAFSDDDSWWAPGALTVAADLFDAHPRVGLLAARVVVGPEERPDPVCAAMAGGASSNGDGPGTPVSGFVACGSVVRREAFLAVGGFRLGYGVGGEEELLAIDLATSGWSVRYCPELVADHHPATLRAPAADRRRFQARNALRTAWLRRRPMGAVRCTARIARAGLTDPAVARGVADAVGDLRWIWHERRPVERTVEADLARL